MSEKQSAKQRREQEVLLGLVDLYLQSGKPIGSHTLKDNGFDHLSSATIRNYFAGLESSGFLKQQHASGGRIPTHLGYKLYALNHLHSYTLNQEEELFLQSACIKKTKEVTTHLHAILGAVSEMTKCAGFLSSPRFDQDFVRAIRLLKLDEKRYLYVITTDFGMVHTDVLYTHQKISQFLSKRLEEYFTFRITGQSEPSLSGEEKALGAKLYNEIILRHVAGYAHFTKEDIYTCGFAELLQHGAFQEISALSNTLSIFENTSHMRGLLQETMTHKDIKFWIGNDLSHLLSSPITCSVIAVPYTIHQSIVGSLAILAPENVFYPRAFAILRKAASMLSETLTSSIYHFKLSYREPTLPAIALQRQPTPQSLNTKQLLLGPSGKKTIQQLNTERGKYPS